MLEQRIIDFIEKTIENYDDDIKLTRETYNSSGNKYSYELERIKEDINAILEIDSPNLANRLLMKSMNLFHFDFIVSPIFYSYSILNFRSFVLSVVDSVIISSLLIILCRVCS